MSYYFDDIIELQDFDFDNISIDEKPHKNILIYNIPYKSLIGPKPLCKIYNGTRDFLLNDPEKYDAIYNRIRYLIRLKTSITNNFSDYHRKIKVDSYDSLLVQKTLTFHNVIMITQSVLNKDKNHYYYNIFLGKCLYQLVKKNNKNFIHSIILFRFGETNVTKEKFYSAKKSIKNWDVNGNIIVIPKLILFRIDDEKLLEKYKAIWNKTEDLKKN